MIAILLLILAPVVAIFYVAYLILKAAFILLIAIYESIIFRH